MSAFTERRLAAAMKQVEALAADRGVEADDLLGFVLCLQVWIAKGETFERAIEQNLSTWKMLLQNTSHGMQNELSRHRRSLDELVAWATDAVHEASGAKAGSP
jgi:hypothetical protein